MAQRVAQVDDERFEVIAEASSRRAEAGALELCDQGPEPLPCVALVLCLVERLPVGLAHSFALAFGQLGEQVAQAVDGAALAVLGRASTARPP